MCTLASGLSSLDASKDEESSNGKNEVERWSGRISKHQAAGSIMTYKWPSNQVHTEYLLWFFGFRFSPEVNRELPRPLPQCLPASQPEMPQKEGATTLVGKSVSGRHV